MFSELKEKLYGPFYTIFTPFLSNEEIDFESLEKYLSLLYKQGARKFYAMAYNSRYSQMSFAEIKSLNEFCIKFLKKIDPENIVVVGDPIHCSTRDSLDYTLHAKDSGADMISLIVREKYFFDEQILDHFSFIGETAKFPILVHEMPFLSGYDGLQMHWPVSLIKKLPKIKQIIALKEDAKDYDIACEAYKLEPSIRIILAGGGKKRFIEFMDRGASCWLNGISMFDASIAETFWKACINKDKKTQDFIIYELEEPFFSSVVKKYGWHRTNKALLQAAGIMNRRERMPLQQLNDSEYLEVLNLYNTLAPNWEKFKSSQDNI